MALLSKDNSEQEDKWPVLEPYLHPLQLPPAAPTAAQNCFWALWTPGAHKRTHWQQSESSERYKLLQTMPFAGGEMANRVVSSRTHGRCR